MLFRLTTNDIEFDKHEIYNLCSRVDNTPVRDLSVILNTYKPV